MWSHLFQVAFSLCMILSRMQLIKYKKPECSAGPLVDRILMQQCLKFAQTSSSLGGKITDLYSEVYLKTGECPLNRT